MLLVALVVAAPTALAAMQDEDPYLWLEEIQGERALAQVERWNKATEDDLTPRPGFAPMRAPRARNPQRRARRSRCPTRCRATSSPTSGATPTNPRGALADLPARRLSRRPAAMADADRRRRARPERRAAPGSGTAPIASRPNIAAAWSASAPAAATPTSSASSTSQTGRFVEGGFTLPEAKTNVTWLDRDRLLVVTDYGPESLTKSGYGRIAKIWRRGTPLAEAQTIAEADAHRHQPQSLLLHRRRPALELRSAAA